MPPAAIKMLFITAKMLLNKITSASGFCKDALYSNKDALYGGGCAIYR